MTTTELKKLYETDVYAWAMKNAELIRQGRLDEIDAENVAEEIESMGRSEKRELTSRLAVLLAHLLKWQYQPERRGKSWQVTIKEQRLQVAHVLRDNPSLKPLLDETIRDAYETARLFASRDTDLSEMSFPEVCPYGFEDVLDKDFWPD